MKLKNAVMLIVSVLLAVLINTSVYAAYTESFTIVESGSTKDDNSNENTIVIRNNRDISDVKKRGMNLREAYIKFDIAAYDGKYPVSEAKLKVYLKQRPSNNGVTSDSETPFCDVYAFGSLNSDWSGTEITYTDALTEGIRPDVDELSKEIKTYSEDKVCGWLDMCSFDANSSVTEAYYFDITPFVNDLLLSGQTVGTICLMQAGGSISRESTVMQFYCEDTATDTAMIPAVEITPSVKTVVKTIKDVAAGKKPSVIAAGYNNTDTLQKLSMLAAATDKNGRLCAINVTEAELDVSTKAQPIRINFENVLPTDITEYDFYVYTLADSLGMKLINGTVIDGKEKEIISSAKGEQAEDFPSISECKIENADMETGLLTLEGSIDQMRAGVEVAARAYITGDEKTSLNQAFGTALTKEDGSFTLTLAMPDKTDSYEILVEGLNIKAEKKIENVIYYSPGDVKKAFDAVDGAEDAEKTAELLSGENEDGIKYTELLGIEYAPALEMINDTDMLSDLCNYIFAKKVSAGGSFGTLPVFHNELKEAADIGKIASSSTVSDEIINIIEGYVNETEIYNSLFGDSETAIEDEIKDLVILSMLGKSYNSPEDIRNAFDEAAIVAAITNVLYGRVEEIMSIGKDILGFDINDIREYQNLNSEKRAKVMKEFNGADIDDADDVLEFLENAVDDVIKATKKPSSSGGGGGGGSSSGGVVINVKKEELKADIPEPIDVNNISDFSDMDNHEWAKESVDALVKANVIANAELFRPDDNVTRAEFVKMLVCAVEIPMSETDAGFTDTKPGMWHYKYIATAYANGIASGIDESLFGVDKNITRQEMAALAYRLLKMKDINLSLADCAFSDINSISDWALTAVCALKNAGIISGATETEFAPLKNATRAEAAVIINRLKMYIDGKGVK